MLQKRVSRALLHCPNERLSALPGRNADLVCCSPSNARVMKGTHGKRLMSVLFRAGAAAPDSTVTRDVAAGTTPATDDGAATEAATPGAAGEDVASRAAATVASGVFAVGAVVVAGFVL